MNKFYSYVLKRLSSGTHPLLPSLKQYHPTSGFHFRKAAQAQCTVNVSPDRANVTSETTTQLNVGRSNQRRAFASSSGT